MNSQAQHYVQEAFLRGFTTGRRGVFHQALLVNRRVKQIAVSQVCHEPDFYDIEDKDTLLNFGIDQADYIEKKGLSRVERVIMPVLEKIQKHESYLLRSEFGLLIDYYLVQKKRTRYFRRLFDDQVFREKVIEEQLAGVKAAVDANLNFFDNVGFDLNRFAANYRSRPTDDKESQRIHLTGLLSMLNDTDEYLSQLRLKMSTLNFEVLEAPEGHYFITSDNPGLTVKRRSEPPFTYGFLNTNFGSFDGIIFPINSKQAIQFWGFDRSNHVNVLRRIRYRPAQVDHVFQINQGTILFAEEKVFCENGNYLKSLISQVEIPRRSTKSSY